MVWRGVEGNKYQLQPPGIWFIPQVLFEVKAIHILIDEGERVCLGGVDPHEWYYINVSVVKEVAYAGLSIKPL